MAEAKTIKLAPRVVGSAITITKMKPGDALARMQKALKNFRFPVEIDLFWLAPTWTPQQAAWIALDIDPRFTNKEGQSPLQTKEVQSLHAWVLESLEILMGSAQPPPECLKHIRQLGIEPSWVSEIPNRVDIESDAPDSVTVTDYTEWRDDPKLLKGEKQERAVLAMIEVKEWNPMSVPDGEKGTLEALCRADYPEPFNCDTSFATTWKRGNKKRLWRIQSYASYAKLGQW